MASNQRLLKAYLRYDDTGRISPGSLILRPNIPKGRGWVEVPAYECCNTSFPISNTITIGEGPGTVCVYGFEISCDEVYILGAPFNFGTTLISVLAGLNSIYGFLGVWSAPTNGTIQLAVKDDVAKSLCPNGTLSIAFFCGG
jgi:hypothetical protein